jgi:hypothetical protein
MSGVANLSGKSGSESMRLLVTPLFVSDPFTLLAQQPTTTFCNLLPSASTKEKCRIDPKYVLRRSIWWRLYTLNEWLIRY